LRVSKRILAAAACAVAIAAIAALPAFAAEEKPSPKPAAKPAQGRPAGKPAQTQTAPADPNVQTQPGITVRENYFLDLPGFDLSTLTPRQKERFLERVNKELCTCGCPNDTIARCLVNDPACKTVRGLAEKILSEVKAGSGPEGADPGR
jgi:hypothetical protein